MHDANDNKRLDSYNSQDDLEKLYLTEKKNPSVVSYNLSSDIEHHNFIIVTKQEKLLDKRHSKDYYQNYEKTFKNCTLLRILNGISLFILIDTVILNNKFRMLHYDNVESPISVYIVTVIPSGRYYVFTKYSPYLLKTQNVIHNSFYYVNY